MGSSSEENPKGKEATRNRYDFKQLEGQAAEHFDGQIAAEITGAAEQSTPTEAWGQIEKAVQGAMERHVPEAAKKPRRVWISAETMEMLEHRKALAAAGLVGDAQALDKDIRKAAKEDKKLWLTERLKDAFWDPIKEATRGAPSRVVSLKPKKKAPLTDTGNAADIYAEHLRTEQWGRKEGIAEDPGWGTTPLTQGPTQVNQEPITMEELVPAIKESSRGKAPGLDGIPTGAWVALSESREELLAVFNKFWREESFPDQWKEALVVGIFKKGAVDDPANYRPISLLATAYKIYGRILAKRLERGLEDWLRTTQYGFRKGHSTTEPMFILRRLQDLVQERKDHALHLIFLDWSKAFDKVDTGCLPVVLKRFGVPDKVINVIKALVDSPLFRVSMQEEMGGTKEQGTGIRQGCTLSPFLFTLILSAVMADVESEVRRNHPMATTPIMSVMDLEYADDTVLLARSAEVARALLAATEREAAKYGLQLNRDKTCRLAFNSEEKIGYEDRSQVPRVKKVEYLGVIMDERGDPTEEVNTRVRKALHRCQALRPIWATRSLPKQLTIRILRSCVFSGLLYGLHTTWLSQINAQRIDALQLKCLRRALGIRSTYASKVVGEEAVTNREVARRAGEIPLSTQVQRMQYKLLGHVLRQEGSNPMRAISYDRLGQPRKLGGKNAQSKSRTSWTDWVMSSAAREITLQQEEERNRLGARRSVPPAGTRTTE